MSFQKQAGGASVGVANRRRRLVRLAPSLAAGSGERTAGMEQRKLVPPVSRSQAVALSLTGALGSLGASRSSTSTDRTELRSQAGVPANARTCATSAPPGLCEATRGAQARCACGRAATKSGICDACHQRAAQRPLRSRLVQAPPQTPPGDWAMVQGTRSIPSRSDSSGPLRARSQPCAGPHGFHCSGGRPHHERAGVHGGP